MASQPTPFDAAASVYDAEFTDSLTGRAQRDLVWRHLARRYPEGAAPLDICELNCGTGEDALWLARRGHRVLATDAAGAMVAWTAAKAAAAGHKVEIAQQPIERLGIDTPTSGRSFDLLFSNFGGLNCVSPAALAIFGKRAESLVRPGGRLVAVVMPRFCLWETAANLARLRPRQAFRRIGGGPVQAHVTGAAPFPIWYYGAGALAKCLGPGFALEVVRPIGFVVPPSALEPRFGRRAQLVRKLVAIDAALPGTGFAAMADHVLVDFRRRG